MAKEKELSPVMQQYVSMKHQVPDALLLFRLGDFFEAFFNDAKIISKALDIVLTKRGTDADGSGIPMCGIPEKAADSYIGRLVKAGFRVAIADQMETPEAAKLRGAKQIRREVVRVITPGTLTDETLLSAKSRNMLMAVVKNESPAATSSCTMDPGLRRGDERGQGPEQRRGDEGGRDTAVNPRYDGRGMAGDNTNEWWLAACDISTGEFLVGSATFDIFEIIARINPAEVIMPEEFSEDPVAIKIKNLRTLHFVHKNVADRSDAGDIKDRIFGRRHMDNPSVDLLAVYLYQTQRGAPLVFQAPKGFNSGRVLSIDASSYESLEIDKSIRADGASLLDMIDRTKTSMGARRLKAYLREIPMEMAEISARHAIVEFLVKDSKVRDDAAVALCATPDISRSLTRLVLGRGNPRDLISAREFTKAAARFRALGVRLNEDFAEKFSKISEFRALRELFENALADEAPTLFRDGGTIKAGYSKPLDHLRNMGGNAKNLVAGLQKTYIDKTGIATLKIKFNNMLGYFVEVMAKYAEPLMDKESGFIHRQTIANNMRFTTGELANLDSEIRSSADKALALEQELILEIIEKVKAESEAIIEASNLIADLDVWVGLAEAAEEFYWAKPTMVAEPVLKITGGRHPVVEKMMRAKAVPFVPNDCDLAGGGRAINLITGPNMAGKSTYLRQNALIVILAHLGSFVPAASATIGLCDKLFSRVGASDNLAQGQSTFMVEMSETANILRNATRHSFVILDEIGRGTATWDGMAIAQATLEFLDSVSPRTIFATHYHELTELKLASLVFSTMQVKEHKGEIVFMYKVAPEATGKSYGIHVAKLAGMPDSVVARAEQILKGLENHEAKKPQQQSLF
ncbi:MAG: DNA mismatch repair protein MutS [Rickettsiales bacterium]|nr:DNA mismatch repair protein MutS [Rickettsiales bacterium]